MFEGKKDVHESICQRGVEAHRQRWRGRRQGVAHIVCGLGEREQFIISGRLKRINCLEIYILYNYFGSIVSDESHNSVKLMH